MAVLNILVIDDNPANLKLATRVLESDGFSVSQALSAEDGLDMIRKHSPDLVLVDIELPGMDGLELVRVLKADKATRLIPLIALTAYAMAGDEQRAIDAGCIAYLTKPIDTRALSAQVAAFLASEIQELS